MLFDEKLFVCVWGFEIEKTNYLIEIIVAPPPRDFECVISTTVVTLLS